MIVKFVALVKELIVAYQFGTSDSLDAFLIAFLIPSFIMSLVTGSFIAAFMPTFIQVREQKGQEAAQNLLSNVVILSTLLLFIVSLIMALTSSFLISFVGAGFSAEKIQLTQRLFFILLPIVLISGATTIWSAVLNAYERFILVAVTPVIISIFTILFLLIFGTVWGIYALTIGTVVGFYSQAVLVSIGLKSQHFTITPRWHGLTPELKQTVSQLLPMLAGSLLMNSTTIVDQTMAASLEAGSVSVLNYSNRIVSLILFLSAGALGTAILPFFSKMVANEDWHGIRNSLKKFIPLILVISMPIVLLLIIFSTPLVYLLYERGAFTSSDTILVGHVQALLVIQIPFYILGILFVRLISSLKANHILMWGTLISFVINISLNYIFMKYMGIAGIALSTSIVYVISFCYLSITGMRHFNKQSKYPVK